MHLLMYLEISEADQLFFSEQNPTSHKARWLTQYVGDLFSTLFVIADQFSILYRFMTILKGVSAC